MMEKSGSNPHCFDGSNPDLQRPLRRVWVAGMWGVTALGNTIEDTWRHILQGNTGILPMDRFSTETYMSDYAACIPGMPVSAGRSRMLDMLERLTVQIGPLPENVLIITATTKADIDLLENIQNKKNVDHDEVLYPHRMPGIVANMTGSGNPGFNISAACVSASIAVGRAASLISRGCHDAILVCCMDFVSEFVFSGFSSLKILSPTPCQPFDRDRQGLSLGDGACAILLMAEDHARKDNRTCLGTIDGWAMSNDASHMTSPSRDAKGLVQAICWAVNRAGIRLMDIGVISAHGTGTIYNDLMEITAFHKVFQTRQIPVYSVKGAIGHTLGAAGGMEVCLGIKALNTGLVPSTIGLTTPMAEAMGMVSTVVRNVDTDFLMTTNSGFGGINSSIILGKSIA